MKPRVEIYVMNGQFNAVTLDGKKLQVGEYDIHFGKRYMKKK